MMRYKTLISLLVLLIASQSVFASADLHEFLSSSNQHAQSHQALESSHQHASSAHQHQQAVEVPATDDFQNADSDCGHCCQCHSPNLVYVLTPGLTLHAVSVDRSKARLSLSSNRGFISPALRPPIV